MVGRTHADRHRASSYFFSHIYILRKPSISYALIYGHVVALQLNLIQLMWIGGLTGGHG